MNDKLSSFISGLRSNRRLFSFDEASTKQAVILRLLNILEWDSFNIDEVTPEFSVGGKRVDYALRLAGRNKVFLEVKRIGEELEAHQEQLLNYSFQEGVKLSILTNGVTWWFYLPLHEGSWEQRRFYTVDLTEQETSDITLRFIQFLARQNVSSGAAIEHAEGLYNSQQKRSIVKEAIPRAWNKIISEPDELLVELIGETTERLCGFRPDVEMVGQFLSGLNEDKPLTVPADRPREKVNRRQPMRPPEVKTPGYLHMSINGFDFQGKYYLVRTWKELLVRLSEVVEKAHGADFRRALALRGTKRIYFATKPDQMREPAQIGNTGYYVETHWSANSMVKVCLDLLNLFGYKEQDIRIDATKR